MSNDYRRPWTLEEDTAIKALVEEFGLKKWSIVAQNLAERYNIKHRSGKQCRERWHNHLDSSIDKKPWTKEEDSMIFELHKEYGKSWSKIAENIPGRTDNSVKNRFYSTLRRNLRKYNKARPHSQRLIGSVRTILRNPEIPDILLQEHAPPRLKKNQEYCTKEVIEDIQKELTELVEKKDEETEKLEVAAPVPCVKLEADKKKMPGFERCNNNIDDASLLISLSQPELNYFYFYPQAMANYKNAAGYPGFICPMFPPAVYPMVLPNIYLKQDVIKK